MPSSVRLSLLDRSRTRRGESDGQALGRSIARARRAEQLGYHRFWVAEHHGVPGIASGTPAVLAGAIAAATERIRVGSGGVMLPNHQPLVVAEQFLTLEALHPGRIDLGVGRSLGFTAPVRAALRSTDASDDRFESDLAELRAALDGAGPVTVRPAVAPPPLFILAIGPGLAVAARTGLPVVLGGAAVHDEAGIRAYRQTAGVDQQIIVSLDVMVAETSERARQLLLPEAWAMAVSRDIGEFPPLESVSSVLNRRLTLRQQRAIDAWMDRAIYGDADSVRAQLASLAERTGAREIMATTSTFDGDELADADGRLAALFI